MLKMTPSLFSWSLRACVPGHFWNKKTARCLATRGRWNFRETLLGFFERGLGGGEAGYWHAER